MKTHIVMAFLLLVTLGTMPLHARDVTATTLPGVYRNDYGLSRHSSWFGSVETYRIRLEPHSHGFGHIVTAPKRAPMPVGTRVFLGGEYMGQRYGYLITDYWRK